VAAQPPLIKSNRREAANQQEFFRFVLGGHLWLSKSVEPRWSFLCLGIFIASLTIAVGGNPTQNNPIQHVGGCFKCIASSRQSNKFQLEGTAGQAGEAGHAQARRMGPGIPAMLDPTFKGLIRGDHGDPKSGRVSGQNI